MTILQRLTESTNVVLLELLANAQEGGASESPDVEESVQQWPEPPQRSWTGTPPWDNTPPWNNTQPWNNSYNNRSPEGQGVDSGQASE